MQNRDSPSTEHQYCSEHNSAEPLWGTADTVDVWLFLEYRPAWKARASTDNSLAAPAARWLSETLSALPAAGFRVRPQFVRQPESERQDTRLLIAVNDRVVEFSGQGYDFLQSLDLAALIRNPEELVSRGRELTEPVYLVCTNGQRDLCCARFGLPVYAAIRERVGARVWQVTHLGGHRFAPNVLVLPSACLYGRVTVATVDDFLSTVEQGDLDFPRLRGRSRYESIVQAAEACIGRQGLRLVHIEGDDAQATLSFADGRELVKVSLRRTEAPVQVTKSCGDEPVEVFPYIIG